MANPENNPSSPILIGGRDDSRRVGKSSFCQKTAYLSQVCVVTSRNQDVAVVASGEARCAGCGGAVGTHGPSMWVASALPGHGGIVMHRNRSASVPVQRYWKAVPTAMSMETPGVERSPLPRSRHAANFPPAGQDVPELAHCGMDGRPVHLPRRDRGMDHASGRAHHQGSGPLPQRGSAHRGFREAGGSAWHSFASSGWSVALKAGSGYGAELSHGVGQRMTAA